MSANATISTTRETITQRRWIDSMTTPFVEQLRQYCKDDTAFERLKEILSASGLGTSFPHVSTKIFGEEGSLAGRVVQDQWLARLIDDVLPDVVYLYSPIEQRYLYANQAITRYGFTVQELTEGGAEVVRKLLHPDEFESVMHKYEQAMMVIGIPSSSPGDEIFTPYFEIQCRMRCADGSYRWVHDRRYVLERTPNGLPSLVLGYVHDLQSMKELQDLLEYRTGLEKVTSSISREFAKIAVADIDSAIINALRNIGESAGADRVYIYLMPKEFDGNAEVMNQAYRWSAPGLPPMVLNTIDPQELGWAFDRLLQLRSIQIARLDSLPQEAHKLRKVLEQAETKSLLVVPLHIEGRVIGIMGMSAVRRERVWTKEEVRMLRLNAETLVYAFERKRAEQVLRESEARFRTIFNRAPLAISILNPQGKLLSHNEQLSKLLGYSAEDLQTMTFLDAVHPEFRDRSEELFYELITGAMDSLSLELQYIHKDGSPVWINLTSSVVRDSEGKAIFVIRMLEDISERKQSEANMTYYTTLLAEHREALERQSDMLLQLNGEMMQKQRELEEINRSKDKFFSIISHDLRSPFSSLLGISKLLAEGANELTREEIIELATAMNQQTHNVYDFMENLLKWAQAHTGRMQFKPTVLALEDITDSVEMLMKESATAKGITLTNAVSNDIAVFADENMIRSVIQNLVSNALKFTPIGGTVTISALPHPTNAKMVEVKVTDTGVGMSEEDAKKLFRIDVVHTTKGTEDESGSGLGLILCKELVEKNKGKIRVESILGKGTTFTFTLPLAMEL